MATIKETILNGTKQLVSANIEDANFNILCMASNILNCTNTQLPLHYNDTAKEEFIIKINSMIERRIKHEPLQYILGNWDFLDFTVKVDKRALIPRPETEEVFLAAKKLIKEYIIPRTGEKFYFADIGTGSGVLGIAMARTFTQSFGCMSDISEDALNLAKENAKELIPNCEKHVEFIIHDLINNFAEKSVDVIISNPPYIKKDDIKNLMPEIRDYEPHTALNSGYLGYEMPVCIIQKAEKVLKHGGLVIVEHGDGQQKDILKYFNKDKWKLFEGKKDLSNKERYVYGILA